MKQVNTIQEAAVELQKQLQDKDSYAHNYKLLNGIEEYLQNCEDRNAPDFNQADQVYNYLAYDLKWEERTDELFPMSL